MYRPGQPAETVHGYDQELSGEPVLPGFRLDLRPAAAAAQPSSTPCIAKRKSPAAPGFLDHLWAVHGPVPSAEGLPTNWINYKTGLKVCTSSCTPTSRRARIGIELTQPDVGVHT
ncbi:MAG: hypothetical protein WKG07_24610, partial [Hymenobacter sp.]